MLNETVTTIIKNDVIPTIVNQVSNSTIWLARMFNSLVTDWTGANWVVPMRVAKKLNGGSFTGMQRWDTSSSNNVRSLTFNIQSYAEPVVIPGLHKAISKRAGDNQVVSVVAEKMDEAREAMRANLSTIGYSVGLGDDWDGLEVAIDNGTNAPSYGGVTRSSYSFMNSVLDTTTTTITQALTLANFDNVSAVGDAEESPTIGITTSALWRTLEATISSQLQAHYITTSMQGYDKVGGGTPKGQMVPENKLKGAFGVDAFTVRARPVAPDDSCTSSVFYWINENKFEFRALRDPDLTGGNTTPEVDDTSGDMPASNPIQFRDMMTAIDQYGEIGAFIVSGQLGNKAPRRSGKLTNKS